VKRSGLARIGLALLRTLGEVRRDEAVTTVLLSLLGFLLLTVTYVIKVLREALILSGGGAEVKSYAAAMQIVLLTLLAWGYSYLAVRLNRAVLIGAVNLFFIGNLLLFFALGTTGVPVGIPFFLWAGIFNVTTLAQYWSLASDVFSHEQGKRLFGIVGVGGSLGAVLGARLAGWLFAPLGPWLLMLASGGILLACLGLVVLVHRRERVTPVASLPVATGEPLQRLLADRYLLLLAAFTLLINWISTNGEYILDRQLLQSARLASANHVGPLAEYVAAFRARFFSWVNLASLLAQCFLVSRLMQRLGLRVALFLTPLIWLGGYLSMAALPTLTIIATAKGAQNSAEYSLQNTARHALFLVTSREEKYSAKTVIDTLFWRSGDVLAAGVVWVGRLLLLGTLHFVGINLGLILLLLVVVGITSRYYDRRLHRHQAETSGDA